MKTFLNILGGIAATILSLILICILMTLPIWQGVAGLLQPKALESVIEEIDLAEVVTIQPELVQSLTESGISEEAAKALLACDAVEELLQSMANDALKALRGEFIQTNLSQEVLAELVNEHREELVEVVLMMAPAELALNDEGANLLLDQLLAEQGGLLITTINDAMLELQREMQTQNITEMVVLVTNGTVSIALIVTALIFAALIYLCRLRHAQGLIWLSVDAIIAALPTFAVAVAMMGKQLLALLSPDMAVAAAITPLLHHAGTSILIGGIVLIALGALCIVGFVLLRDRRMKKEAAAMQAALPEVE